MNKALAKIAADLFAKSKGGEDQSSKVQRLRGELKKVIERDDTIFGKFRVLLESFREVIPDEKQRYHAAIKALSTTSKLSQKEIIKAVNDQIEELKVLEKSMVSAGPGWRDELKSMEARSKGIQTEIAGLKERIAKLESEDAELLKGIAEREKDAELVAKSLRELFAEIGSEIALIKTKVEEFIATESAAAAPPPPKEPVKAPAPAQAENKAAVVEKKAAAEPLIEIQAASAQPSSEFQKKCPMCGGLMNFHKNERMWMCYSCAYEEAASDDDLSQSREKSPPSSPFAPAPTSWPASGPSASAKEEDEESGADQGSSSASNEPTDKKPCPVCKKTMYFFPRDKAWRCPSCYYERRI